MMASLELTTSTQKEYKEIIRTLPIEQVPLMSLSIWLQLIWKPTQYISPLRPQYKMHLRDAGLLSRGNWFFYRSVFLSISFDKESEEDRAGINELKDWLVSGISPHRTGKLSPSYSVLYSSWLTQSSRHQQTGRDCILRMDHSSNSQSVQYAQAQSGLKLL